MDTVRALNNYLTVMNQTFEPYLYEIYDKSSNSCITFDYSLTVSAEDRIMVFYDDTI